MPNNENSEIKNPIKINEELNTQLSKLFYSGIGEALTYKICNGYDDCQCLWAFQHVYTICKFQQLLNKYQLPKQPPPSWLQANHCLTQNLKPLISYANSIDKLIIKNKDMDQSCKAITQSYIDKIKLTKERFKHYNPYKTKHDKNICIPPWLKNISPNNYYLKNK